MVRHEGRDQYDGIGVGDRAPAFVLPSSTGMPVTLGEFRGRKRVVLFFMREFT